MKKTLLLNYFKAATSHNPRKNTTRCNGLLALFVMVMGMNGVYGQTTYNLITSTSDLTAGSKYIVVSSQLDGSAFALGYQNTSNRPQASVTISSGAITTTPATSNSQTTAVFELTLGGSTGLWTLYDAANSTNIGANSNTSNNLRANASSTWTISFSSNAAVMTSTGGTRNILRYNSGNSLFSCYATAQASVYLYKASTSGPTITTSVPTIPSFISSNLNTLSSEQSFTVSGSNLTNDITIIPPTGYEVSTASGSGFDSTVTLTQSGGTVNTTNIYVRFNPSALTEQVGGNITCASTGASTQNIAVSGEVTNLSAGGIAFIAFQGASTDYFRIVALEDIPANTRIWFTDKAWDGNVGTLAFTSGEENTVWTSPNSTVNRGTVIEFAVGAGTVNLGTGAFSSGLGSAGEQLFAYQGTLTSPTFIAGYTSGTIIATGVPTASGTDTWVPASLTNGTNFVALGGITFGSSYITASTINRSLSDMRSFIHNFDNLTTSNTSTTTYSSWPTYAFNFLPDEPTTQPSFTAASNVGNNQMDLNFNGGNGTSYIVVMREGSAVSATPSDATNYSAVSGSVNFSSATELSAGQKIVYNGTTSTGTVTVTNLSPGTTYHFAIYAYNGTGTLANFFLTSPSTGNQLTTGTANSNTSDIIVSASFTEPSDIAYASNQENTNLTFGNSIEVAQFTLRDGGATTDGDANSTTINSITFTISNHVALRRLALYDGSTELGEVAISSGTATFSGLTLAANDNSSKDFSLRASFAGTIVDNTQFSFTVSSVTADIAGSTFATADAGAAITSTADDRNRIEVTADRLTFVQQPSNVSVNTAISPAPSVSANDALANRDLDYVTDMTVTTTGTFGTATTIVSPVAGLGTFSNLQFSAAAIGRTIAFTSGSLAASGNSNDFDITLLIMPGDIAFVRYQTDTPDAFSIITFVEIPANQTFYFTDNAWTTASGPLATNENTMTWTTPVSAIPAGTVITFTDEGTTSVTPSGNGSASGVLNGLAASGDQILMFRGTNSTSPAAFICGVSSTDWITTGTTTSNDSYLPTDLSLHNTAISFSTEQDNGYYNQTQTGSIATIKALVNNGSNWIRSTSIQSAPTFSFDLNSTTTTISASATVQNLSLEASEKFVIGANTLTINGAVSGSGTISGGSTSNLTTTGTTGTLFFDQTTPGTTNVLKNLTLSSGTATLGNVLNITAGASSGIVAVGSGATLATGGFLTLKSDTNGTASVGNSAGTITGNVTVERYLPAKRAWRALTAPLKGSDTSIFSQWQNNGTISSGIGVELWGPGGTGSSGNGLAVGPSSSILQYGSGVWNPVENTKTSNLFTTSGNNAFMIFPTGGYGSGNIASSSTATATTLRATGQLIMGDVPFTGLSSTHHTLIGNPYASPINLNSILDANATLEKLFWVWDPNGANQGAYNMFDADANSYTVTNLSYTNSTVIQSGQAFFVKALSGQTGSFTISESNKSTSSTNNVFRNNNPAELLRVGLYKQENNEWSGRDGAMTVILPDANANQSPNKMANGSENIAFVKNGSLFASEHHLPLVASDVLNIRVWRTTAGANYKLKINTEQFASTNLNATLEDLFTNSRTPLNLEGTAVEYPFTVTTDALSTGDRFRIVFQNAVLGTNNPTATSFSIVPNPVIGDSFQVNLGTLATGIYSYSICNAIGQEVEKGTINNVTQNTNYEVKMSNSATGIYIMKIKGNDNTVFTAKIIKK
jgi:hypothetical protein